MRLSREKVIHLSHLLVNKLGSTPGVVLRQPANDIRLRVVDSFLAFLKREEAVAERARQKIRSQTRKIPEGSADWDALFRQYYAEEMAKLRKVK